MGALDGKVALVTGAASGLGRESAKLFAKEGAQVVIVDINRAGGDDTVAMIKDAGGDATFVMADVSKAEDTQAMVRAAVDTYGGLDCAHNNAAISIGARPLAEIPVEDWERGIAVDLGSVFLGMKYEIPAMLERGGGAIVNTASAGGTVATPGSAPYIAAKYGIIGMTKVAALDYGARGIRVNAISPGAMMTPMMRARSAQEPGHFEHLERMHPIGRLAEPEEVAAAAVWLCTDAASFVLGHCLSVDGGYVIH
jgi:NAD(P)-dependent dehydrogenase (short-subunit alcohol dehydrogenase family)